MSVTDKDPMQVMTTALNKLAKWRRLFVGWQLGARPKGDPEADAVSDYQEGRLLMRAEITALTGLLIKKGIATEAEVQLAIAEEADELCKTLERRFPGVHTTSDGLSMDKRVLPWMKGWKL